MSTTKEHSLSDSRALWNRHSLALESDEVLAQILDRGDMKDWRALYLLCKSDPLLRGRIHHIIRTVPLPLPHFWMAALRSLGEAVDWNEVLPPYGESPIWGCGRLTGPPLSSPASRTPGTRSCTFVSRGF